MSTDKEEQSQTAREDEADDDDDDDDDEVEGTRAETVEAATDATSPGAPPQSEEQQSTTCQPPASEQQQQLSPSDEPFKEPPPGDKEGDDNNEEAAVFVDTDALPQQSYKYCREIEESSDDDDESSASSSASSSALPIVEVAEAEESGGEGNNDGDQDDGDASEGESSSSDSEEDEDGATGRAEDEDEDDEEEDDDDSDDDDDDVVDFDVLQMNQQVNRRRRSSVLTFLCIPCMFVFSILMIFMVIIFMGLPFCLFLICLLSAYYCCTSDPLPPRVLLRALMDTDDWNATMTVNNGTGGPHRRFTNKQDIEKELIQRICLGHCVGVGVGGSTDTAGDVEEGGETNKMMGRNLKTVDHAYDGRVHWKYQQDDMDEPGANGDDDDECLVFSRPLGESNRSEIDAELMEFKKATAHMTPHTKERLQHVSHHGVSTPTIVPNNEHSNITSIPENGDPDVELGEGGGGGMTLPMTTPHVAPTTPTAAAAAAASPDFMADETSVRERGTVCDICLLDFEAGDVVAWSTNPACDHAYHSDCISDWLLRQPTCPSCRQEYLPPPPAPSTTASGGGADDNNNNPSPSLSSSSSSSSSSSPPPSNILSSSSSPPPSNILSSTGSAADLQQVANQSLSSSSSESVVNNNDRNIVNLAAAAATTSTVTQEDDEEHAMELPWPYESA